MIHKHSLASAQQQRTWRSHQLPDYDRYNFAQIIRSLPHFFFPKSPLFFPKSVLPQPEKEYTTVVLFLLDAFGWVFFEKYKNHPLFSLIDSRGITSLFHSQFPSTTTAQITTLHTGRLAGETGLYEWNMFDPTVGEVIQPLRFSRTGIKEGEELAGQFPDYRFFPEGTTTVYERLQEQGVSTHVVTHQEFVSTTYTKQASAGSMMHGYRDFQHGLALVDDLMSSPKLAQGKKSPQEKQYISLYFGDIDMTGHREGTNSAEFERVVLQTLDSLHAWLQKQTSSKTNSTLFLLTADHGQVAVNPQECFYVNTHVPELLPLLRRDRTGKLLAPAGSARDMFLHVLPDQKDEAVRLLSQKLAGVADVLSTQDAMKLGFFGSQIHRVFTERVGDILILPKENKTVWWFEPPLLEFTHKGHHGGLLPEEVRIPLHAFE